MESFLVENAPTSQDPFFKLSRGPQQPYIEKTKNIEKIIEFINFALFPFVEPPPFTVRWRMLDHCCGLTVLAIVRGGSWARAQGLGPRAYNPRQN